MDNVVIRRGTKRDAPAFLGLLHALAEFEKLDPPSPEAQKRITRDVFQRRKAMLFLALQGGKPVGYALYFYTYSSFLAKPTLYLEDIFVLEGFRRRGVGRALFLKCAGEASANDCGRMEWSVLTWNAKAMRFYDALGAKRLSNWCVYRLDSGGLDDLLTRE